MSQNSRARFTALALGQLSPAESAELLNQLADEPDAVHDMESMARLASQLRNEHAIEQLPAADPHLRALVEARLKGQASSSTAATRTSLVGRAALGAAVSALASALILGVALWWHSANREQPVMAATSQPALPAPSDSLEADSARLAAVPPLQPVEVRTLPPAQLPAISPLPAVVSTELPTGNLLELAPPARATIAPPTHALTRRVITHEASTESTSEPQSVQLLGRLSTAATASSSPIGYALEGVRISAIAASQGMPIRYGPHPIQTVALSRNTSVVPGNEGAGSVESSGPQGFITAADSPLLVVPLVGKSRVAAEVRRTLSAGRWPDPKMVDVAQLVNQLAAMPAHPASKSPGRRSFGVVDRANAQPVLASAEVVVCPWRPAHRLVVVQIGVSANQDDDRAGRPLARFHKVVAELEWNTARVAAYRSFAASISRVTVERLQDPNALGAELTAGSTFTAVYEVVPANAPATLRYQPGTAHREARHQELLTLKLRYDDRADRHRQTEELAAVDRPALISQASPRAQRAVAALAVGLLLQGDPALVPLTWRDLQRWQQWQETRTPELVGAELGELICLARQLADAS